MMLRFVNGPEEEIDETTSGILAAEEEFSMQQDDYYANLADSSENSESQSTPI